MERGELFRIVRDRDVEPEAYTDVLAAFLESPPRSGLRMLQIIKVTVTIAPPSGGV
jgi:hypothetical protein